MAGHTLARWLFWLALALSTPVDADVPAVSKAACATVYGLRMDATGRAERVVDAARCRGADAAFISAYLATLRPQVGPERPLELELTNCSVPVLDGAVLARTPLRRLRINWSGLQRVDADAFRGLENLLQELELSHNLLDEFPAAVRNLTALARLDLSRNRVRSLPQGAVFFHLLKLRHLNLNHNRLGFLDVVRRERNERSSHSLSNNNNNKSNQTGDSSDDGVMSMALFNLEPLREHLEVLQLRSNNITAFPEQFSRPFARLRHLDLSENHFTSIPQEAFTQMPQLQELHLDANAFTRLRNLHLSPSLETLSLRDNPLVCDCEGAWLWRLSQSGQRPRVLLTECRSPAGQRGVHPSRLAGDVCNGTAAAAAAAAAVAAPAPRLGPIDVDVAARTSTSVDVQLRLPAELEAALRNASGPDARVQPTLAWEVTYRRFGFNQQNRVNGSIQLTANQNRWVISVDELQPSTGYRVCVQLKAGAGTQAYCREVTTPAADEPPTSTPTPPVTAAAELAVAAGVSTSTTLAVVVVVCCCCPGCKRAKKKKDAATDADMQVATGDTVADDDDGRLPAKLNGHGLIVADAWPRGPPSFTLQASQNDESMFQATCDYLRRRSLDLTPAAPQLPVRNTGADAPSADYVEPKDDAVDASAFNHSNGPCPPNLHVNSTYGLDWKPPATPLRPPAHYYAWRRPPAPITTTWTPSAQPNFLAKTRDSDATCGAVYTLTSPARPTPQRGDAPSDVSRAEGRDVFSKPIRNHNNKRLHWSAAPPLHTADMLF